MNAKPYAGRISDSDSVNLGSNPSPPAINKYKDFRHFAPLLRGWTKRNNRNGPRTSHAQKSAQSGADQTRADILGIFGAALLFVAAMAWIMAARTAHHYAPREPFACTPTDINTINGNPACRVKAGDDATRRQR